MCLFASLLAFAVPARGDDGPAAAGKPLQSPQAQQPTPPAPAGYIVQRIEFVGNRRVRSDTLKARIFTREGDTLTEETLRRDFQALWNTQYFDDIRLELEDSPDRPGAKIVVFYVKERPVIRRIRYEGLKSVSESDVLERFKDRKVGLSVESQFDPTKIKKAEVVLRELLGEHGRQFAEIKPTSEPIPASNAVILVFKITEGPKVKVGKIIIQGNTAFSDRRIIRSMRHSRPVSIPLKLFDLNVASKTFDRAKLSEDLEIGIRGLYQNNGYFQVLVKDPIIRNVDINRGGLPGPMPLISRKKGKSAEIIIPIEEGEQYRMGKLTIRSSDPSKDLSLKVDALEKVFPLKQGEIFAADKIRKAFEDYRKLYGVYGFIDFTSEPHMEVDDARKVVDLTLVFDEQKPYYVRRIEFQGNITTRDKVIRREILIDEGQLFNNRLWEISILRINQLDYFDPIKAESAVDIKRNVKAGTVDLTLKVKEKGKQSIGFTGGVSGLAGTFIGLTYQTNNFLGLGETLTLSTEFGDRQRNFLFGFTEPYLFDRPISTGFTVFSSRFNFDQSRETSLLIGQRIQLDPNTTQNYSQNSKGFTVFASYPIKRFSFTRLGLTYGYSITNISAFSEASRILFETLQFRGFAGPSALEGIHSSRVSPSLTYNTVGDSVFNPSHGKSFFYQMSFEGGPVLGGNVNAITQVFEAKYFRPIRKKHNILAFRFLGAFGTGYGDRVLPPYSRFYLGGEDTVRGFDIRTIGPVGFIPASSTTQFLFTDPQHVDGSGNPILRQGSVPTLLYNFTFPGGDVEGVGNFEYRIPIAGPVTLAFFFDAGTNGALRRNQLLMDPVGIQQIQAAFPTQSISKQVQLASGTNFKLRTSTGAEVVVQLPILNAPFRLYWAYNLNRLAQTILAPPTFPSLTATDCARLFSTPGICENVILPQLASVVANQPKLNFFDPLRTFRFTVSRTF